MFPPARDRKTRGDWFASRLLAVAALLWLASCGPRVPATLPAGPTTTPAPPTSTPVPAAATVNGEVIPAAEFQSQVSQYQAAQTALGKVVTQADASKAVLEDLIAQTLLAQGARAAGFDLSQSGLQSRLDALATQLGGADKVAEWESAHGYTALSFSVTLKRAAEAAYMRDKIVAAVPKTADQVHVQQILLYNESDARRIMNQITGGADFNAIAGRVDPKTRGELSWFPKGYLLEPRIEDAAFSMEVGAISDLIQTQAGFHIIKVLERDPQHELSPDAYRTLQELALKDWVAQQRASAAVVLAP